MYSRSKFAVAIAAAAAVSLATPASAAPSMTHPMAMLSHAPFKSYAAFATSVALSGDGATALVGAPEALGAGRVYVCSRHTRGWTSQKSAPVLSVPGLANGSHFGYSVSLTAHGKIAVVGAYNASVPAAYVFVRPSSGWKSTSSPRAKLTFAGDSNGSGFGISVSISANGNTILVGSDSTNTPHGEAYIFTKPATGWATSTATANLTDPNGDWMGYTTSLSADGKQALIGTNTAPGAVFVFTQNPAGWNDMTHATAQLSVLGIPGTAQYGYSVAMSGDGRTAVVGSLQDPTGTSGRAYIFTRTGADWVSTNKPNAHLSYAGSSDFGSTVGTDAAGDKALIGQATVSTNPRETAYVFKRPVAGWKSSESPDNRLLEPNATPYEAGFGYAVSLSSNGKTALAGVADRGNGALFNS